MASTLAEHPLVVIASLPFAVTAGLYVAWKKGRHCDIPFKQYLRFQYRLKSRALVRAGQFILKKGESVLIVALELGRMALASLQSMKLHQIALVGGTLVLWAAAIRAGFGAVFVLLLSFAVIFSNLGQRRAGEASAYSVFNPNFGHLDGDLRMEQIEAELRHQVPRGGAVYAQADEAHLDPHGGVLHPSGPLQKLGRNDRVEVVDSATGGRQSVKGKLLQSYLDRGWMQTTDARYEGVRYSLRRMGGSDVVDSDSD